jgi:hypothetical protein
MTFSSYIYNEILDNHFVIITITKKIIFIMSTMNIESTTWFDRLPTEIIFLIFDYLSNNDIIYTFFFFSQRFNHILLQNEHYFNYLQLPTTNFDIWEKILRVIGSQVESLNINTTDLTFLWENFSNLKSIIISSPYNLAEEQAQSIINSKHFNNLHTFRIKENELFSHHLDNQYYVLPKVFNSKSLLKIFQYSLEISSFDFARNRINFQTHLNLH